MKAIRFLAVGLLSVGLVSTESAAQSSSRSYSQSGCSLAVYFPNGVTTTTPRQNAAIAKFVEGAPRGQIVVTGFAGDTRALRLNRRLSEQRATSVGEAVEGAGQSYKALGRAEADRGAKSRRVDVYRDACAAIDDGPLPATLSGSGVLGSPALPGLIGAGIVGAVLGGSGVSTTTTTGM